MNDAMPRIPWETAQTEGAVEKIKEQGVINALHDELRAKVDSARASLDRALLDDLEFFEGGSEFFKWAHVGWSPTKDQRYFNN